MGLLEMGGEVDGLGAEKSTLNEEAAKLADQLKQLSPRDQADAALKLTPEEQNIYQHHLDNLNGNGKVINKDGSISTVYQAVVGSGKNFYNIPTVRDGKILSIDAAQDAAEQEGIDKWPAYPTPEAADARYEDMHKYMEKDTANYLKAHGSNY